MSDGTRRLASLPCPASSGATTCAPRSPTAFTDEVAARFFSTGPDAIPMPNVLATLMHHPALAGPFLAYNNVLLQNAGARPPSARAR